MDLSIKILISLSKYKYLNISQIQKLHSDWSKKTLQKTIRLLRELRFIDTDKYGYHPQF